MVDIVSPSDRSRIMRRIRSKDTQPELLLRKLLFGRGFRFRLHRKDLAGKPDIVLPKWKAVIFVNGCFWHRHEGCSLASSPSTRVDYWERKFEANVVRDGKNRYRLVSEGWRVAIVWECGLRKASDRIAAEVEDWLKNGSGRFAEFPEL